MEFTEVTDTEAYHKHVLMDPPDCLVGVQLLLPPVCLFESPSPWGYTSLLFTCSQCYCPYFLAVALTGLLTAALPLPGPCRV